MTHTKQAMLESTSRELHDAIANAMQHQGFTYSGVQQAVKAVQGIYAALRSAQQAEAVTKCSDPDPAQSVRQPALGDIVSIKKGTPYFHDWRGVEMKLVSLHIDPEGKLWASVIDKNDPNNTKHRGFGVYDGETTDFELDHLESVSPLPSTGLPAPAPDAEVRATARDEMTAAALARIARANLSDPETDDLTVPLAVELAEVQFRLNYMENQYGKIAWDATAPQQDRGE